MFAPRLVIQDDLDGWTVTFRGGGFNPILLFIGSVHFLLGSTFTLGALTTLVGSIGSGEIFLALFALPFGLVGSVFATWPVLMTFRTLQTTRIEVSGRSLRLERSLLGVGFDEVTLPLAECDGVELRAGVLQLAGRKLPIAGSNSREVVELVERGVREAKQRPEPMPPVPAALEALRE